MEDISPPSGFIPVLLFDDPTPNAIVLHRIMLGTLAIKQYIELPKRESDDFIDLVILISRKMISVWKHLESYQLEEKRLIAKLEGNPTHFEFSQTLFLEFDEFTVQIKSTLDYVVKVLRPVLGRVWTVHTFAEKGEKVLKALKNLPKEHEPRVEFMERVLFQDVNRGWLVAVINARDRINHYQDGGMNFRNFAVLRRPDGKIELPMWSRESELGNTMTTMWENFFRYVEGFLALSLTFRLSDQYAVSRTAQSMSSHTPIWTIIPRALAVAMLKNQGSVLPADLL